MTDPLELLLELSLKYGPSAGNTTSDFDARRTKRYNEESDHQLVTAAARQMSNDLLGEIADALSGSDDEDPPATLLFVRKGHGRPRVIDNGPDQRSQKSLKRVQPAMTYKKVQRLRVHVLGLVADSLHTMERSLTGAADDVAAEVALHIGLAFDVVLTGSLGRIGLLLTESGKDAPTAERLAARVTWAAQTVSLLQQRQLHNADFLYRVAHAKHAEKATAMIEKRMSQAIYVEEPQHADLLVFLHELKRFHLAVAEGDDQ